MVSALEFVRQYERKRERRPLMNLVDQPVAEKRKRARKSQKTAPTLSRAKSVGALLDREPWLTIQELMERTGSTYQQIFATLKYLDARREKQSSFITNPILARTSLNGTLISVREKEKRDILKTPCDWLY